ncbi:MAG: LytTR family transcriptional regulator [Clostridiales Family XIII bacterium]|nr:LytTR family transcriptional regulator [Clostridiales Family XIII bacterium]
MDGISKDETADFVLLFEFPAEDYANALLARKIQKRYPQMPVVYLLDRKNYVNMVANNNHRCFVPPPHSKRKILQAIDKVTGQFHIAKEAAKNIRTGQTIVVPNRYGNMILPANEILYCESVKRIVRFHTTGGIYETYAKLGDVEQRLPEHFVRCHQSYLVNFHYVKKVDKLELRLINDKTISVSQRKKKNVKYFLGKYDQPIPKSV